MEESPQAREGRFEGPLMGNFQNCRLQRCNLGLTQSKFQVYGIAGTCQEPMLTLIFTQLSPSRIGTCQA